jgi:hypothetical protein
MWRMARRSVGFRLGLAALVTVAAGGALVGAAGGQRVETTAAAVPEDDRDGDGAIDALDNCLTLGNPDQRDTDRDGFGNRCDGDFDQDGRTGAADEARLQREMGTSSRHTELDGDGRVAASDLAIFRELSGKAPGPVLDADGDGVGDVSDPCPFTTAGARQVVPGCSLLDVSTSADDLLLPARTGLDEIATQLARAPAHAELAAALAGPFAAANDQFELAGRLVHDAAACDGSRAVVEADRSLDAAERVLVAAFDRALAAARPAPTLLGTGVGDVTPAMSRAMVVHHFLGKVRELRGRARRVDVAFSGLCTAARPMTRRGTIAAIHDATRILELTDGSRFSLARSGQFEAKLHPGGGVQLHGYDLGSQTGMANGAVATGGIDPGNPGLVAECVRLRLAPVQLFEPFLPLGGTVTIHRPEGYQVDGQLRLEQGMRVAAASDCQVFGRRFSLRVELAYTRADGVQTVVVLAPDLDGLDHPVAFPANMDPGVTATMTTVARVQVCEPTCGTPVPQVTRVWPVRVVQRGARCSVMFTDGTEYDVNDQIPDDYRTTAVWNLTVAHPSDAGTTNSFAAKGYKMLGGQPSFPQAVTVLEGDAFAIRNTDFYPIFPDTGSLQWVMASRTTGVSYASGLRWPRVHGTWQGRPFRYACTLPRIVRDVVNFCPTRTAFYRLPFLYPEVGWTLGQGNFGTFSHDGVFALDMLEALGTPINAARAGRVQWVYEAESQQCLQGECIPNFLHVVHQDGSLADYVHFPQNGIQPEVGDLVRRGDFVGIVGLTGFTTDPHLHIEMRDGVAGSTVLALYEALDPPHWGQLLTCYEPKAGDVLFSNNDPQP